MNRCSPVVMRKSLLIVSELKRQGIEFVAMPVVSDVDREYLQFELQRRLDILIAASENESDGVAIPVENMHEKDVVDHYRMKFYPEKVEQVVKQKGKVTCVVLDGNGTRRIEKVDVDPWPNCETGRFVIPKESR